MTFDDVLHLHSSLYNSNLLLVLTNIPIAKLHMSLVYSFYTNHSSEQIHFDVIAILKSISMLRLVVNDGEILCSL